MWRNRGCIDAERMISVIKKTLWSREFLNMGLSNFFQFMTQYMMIAALPIFVMEGLAGGEFESGLAMTFFQIGALSCRPFAGRWIDSYNKKNVLLFASGGFLLLTLLYNLRLSLPLLLALRLLHGAIFALGTTTAASLAVLVTPMERRGEGIGYFAVFGNLAMVIGPFFGLLMMRFGAAAMFGSTIVLGALTFWFSNWNRFPPAILLPSSSRKTRWRLADFIESKAVPMALLGGLVFFGYAGVLVFVPLYAKLLGLEAHTSVFFAVFAAGIVLTRPLVGRVFDRFGANAVLYPGFVLFPLGLLLLGRVTEASGFFLAAAIAGCGFGALSPAFQTLSIQSALAERAGVATATYFLALDVSVGIASVVLSLLVGLGGYALMYNVSAAVLFLTALLYTMRSRKVRRLPHASSVKR